MVEPNNNKSAHVIGRVRFCCIGKCFNKHFADAGQGTETLPGQGFNIEKRVLLS